MQLSRHRLIPLIWLLLAVLPTAAHAQYPFGKNKVTYSSKDWKVLQTEHVDIYYYPSKRHIVTFIAPLVEETFQEFSKRFNVEFRDRLPLVFYASHYEFQQTNIVPSLISEYTGGFTDLVKGRIAIPFTGSLWELRHVVRHEMVHAFMLEKLAAVMRERNKFAYSQPPLWFVEGIAEYFASPHADTRSHMFVRDALIHSTLLNLQDIWRIEGSFMMYKQGEAVIRYIALNFGDDAVVQIIENWWVADKFPLVLKHTINMDLRELSDAFSKAIKRRYYPEIMHRTFVNDAAKQITPPRSFHSRPAVATGPDGEQVLYALCAEDGVINVCSLHRDEYGKLVRKVHVEGGRSAAFESIPAFRSKIEVRDNTLLFVAKRQERDAIYLWDVESDHEIAHVTFPQLSVVSSPTLSPDMARVVFSAIDTSGTMDLFLYDFGTKALDRLTYDTYAENDPDFHPSRNSVLFSSDRCENGDQLHMGIYEIDLENDGEITALTCSDSRDAHPDWAPDGGSFLFTSDRDGIFNTYLYDYDEHLIIQQTSVMGGVTTPAFLPDQSGFIISGYYKGEFQLFEFPLRDRDSGGSVTLAVVDSSTSSWTTREPKEYTYVTQNYKQKLALDFAGTGLAVDRDFGSLGNGGALAFSDILGNHQYSVFFGNTSNGGDNFFKRMNLGVNYLDLGHRLNFSIGAFHLTSRSGNLFTIFRSERRFGTSAGLSYPLSKFRRIDASVVLRFVERESDFAGLEDQKSFLGSTFLTYVHDNTLWTVGGPLKGWRYYTTIGRTFDFRGRGFDNTSLHFDVRKYFKITRRIVFAQRFITRHSFGSDFQIFYLGGPWDLRGYDIREFFGKSIYLVNNELRFPLIDRFALALPFGTIEFPLIRGSAFIDTGKVDRFFFGDTGGWIGSLGVGVELNLGFAPVIRVNFTRATDFSTISSDTDLGLFIGLNY